MREKLNFGSWKANRSNNMLSRLGVVKMYVCRREKPTKRNERKAGRF